MIVFLIRFLLRQVWAPRPPLSDDHFYLKSARLPKTATKGDVLISVLCAASAISAPSSVSNLQRYFHRGDAKGAKLYAEKEIHT